MIPVSSSNLRAVGYNPLQNKLTIEFNSGSVYEYYNVPKQVYEGLLNASSKGGYHYKYIKNSYSYSKIR